MSINLTTALTALYFAGGAISVIRFLLFMHQSIDAYDWQFNKFDIWADFTVGVIFWPFGLFATPRWLLNPATLLRPSNTLWDMAEQQRRRDKFWQSPPPCAPIIRFQDRDSIDMSVGGVFLIQTSDINEILNNRPYEDSDKLLIVDTHATPPDEPEIEHWISQCDSTLVEPTDVPSHCWRFKHLITGLVKSGKATTMCLECNKNIPLEGLSFTTDKIRNGWCYKHIVCDQGHTLLSIEFAHFHISSSN